MALRDTISRRVVRQWHHFEGAKPSGGNDKVAAKSAT
jgi:hypothetical protein